MSLFSSEATPRRGDRLSPSSNGISFAISAASHGLFLAMVFGIIIILAVGSILAVQMRPCAAPSGKTLSEHTNQPRLVNTERMIINGNIVMQGGSDHDRII